MAFEEDLLMEPLALQLESRVPSFDNLLLVLSVGALQRTQRSEKLARSSAKHVEGDVANTSRLPCFSLRGKMVPETRVC
jgi:hypothetical protein